jgi:hypothetical protein
LDATLRVTASGGEMADDNENEARQRGYLGDTITDGCLYEAPKIGITKGVILTFLREILVKYVWEESQHPTRLPITCMLKTTLKTPFGTDSTASDPILLR